MITTNTIPANIIPVRVNVIGSNEARSASFQSAHDQPVTQARNEVNPTERTRATIAENQVERIVTSFDHSDRSVAVKGTDRLAGTPLPLGETAGYIFEQAGKPIAAVEVINNGAVWLSPDLDPALRGPVTAAISSLLLFEELRKTLPE